MKKKVIKRKASSNPKLAKKKEFEKKRVNSELSKKEFERYLERVEDPKYKGSDTSWALPKNATLLDKTKYEICKQILVYQQDHNLSDEKMAKKIKISVGETRDILYYHIDYFTLDRLLAYASQLLKSLEIKINSGSKKKGKAIHASV